MNILLINPPRNDGIPVIREDRCEITDRTSVIPPYSLMQLASILKKNRHEVTLIDANGENLTYPRIKEHLARCAPYDIVVFRFTPTTFDNDMRIASLAKATNHRALTVGLCWTLQSFAEEILKSCDSLDVYALGESELVVPDLIETFEQKGFEGLREVRGIAYKIGDVVVQTERSKNDIDYNLLPIPAFDLVNLRNYRNKATGFGRFMILNTSKGCPFGCIYCTVRRTKWKAKSADRVLSEIRTLVRDYYVNVISFFDESFTLDKQRAADICQRLINERLNVVWYCNTRVDCVDPDLLKLMRKAGCRGISYGVESGSQKILENSKKGQNIEQARKAILWTKAAGIKTYASFIVGLPGETWNTVKATLQFVKNTRPNGAQFNVAVPYPKTELYEIAKTNGWITENLDWKAFYQHNSVMRTAQLSPSELDQARKLLYRSLYFNPAWVWENLKFIIRNPEDISVAIRYYYDSLKNYLIYDMHHGH